MNKTFIIAEAGVNHNGRLDLAFRLCDAARAAGADAVKFQTWVTEKIVTADTAMAGYQQRNLDSDQSQYRMLKALELSYAQFAKIKRYCDTLGITFLSTGDNPEDIDFLLGLGMPCIKLGSGDITNIPLLRHVGRCARPVLLSTGMSDLEQVRRAYGTLREAGAKDITVLHCTTNYPCPPEEVNLRAMQTLARELDCPVGYSDHTLGTEVPVAAVAIGACVIEKHLTLDRTMEGPDHPASMEPDEFHEMVRQIRHIESALGDGIKRPNDSERAIAGSVLKRIVAQRDIRKGEVLDETVLAVKRSPTGLGADRWDEVCHTRAIRDFHQDEAIEI
ncbi:MAG: N-acetylneuraminate synthase [Bacteroidales bacterium]|nr:N-acetylneuraminate synthase [Bacteroidales bacterium]